MVPVMAVSDLVATRRAVCGPDPVGDIFKPTATGPGLVHFYDEDDICGSSETVREKERASTPDLGRKVSQR
jgi:hypothetical protein